ncbi:hypothetical protein ACFVMC_08395 [Nocardia sp. NPDC127579]|uniref:hypothetical protein n=1 Tax=Nocardia sp. NPDC127579 TaxID=3345402 RepID=UPI003625AD2B
MGLDTTTDLAAGLFDTDDPALFDLNPAPAPTRPQRARRKPATPEPLIPPVDDPLNEFRPPTATLNDTPHTVSPDEPLLALIPSSTPPTDDHRRASVASDATTPTDPITDGHPGGADLADSTEPIESPPVPDHAVEASMTVAVSDESAVDQTEDSDPRLDGSAAPAEELGAVPTTDVPIGDSAPSTCLATPDSDDSHVQDSTDLADSGKHRSDHSDEHSPTTTGSDEPRLDDDNPRDTNSTNSFGPDDNRHIRSADRYAELHDGSPTGADGDATEDVVALVDTSEITGDDESPNGHPPNLAGGEMESAEAEPDGRTVDSEFGTVGATIGRASDSDEATVRRLDEDTWMDGDIDATGQRCATVTWHENAQSATSFDAADNSMMDDSLEVRHLRSADAEPLEGIEAAVPSSTDRPTLPPPHDEPITGNQPLDEHTTVGDLADADVPDAPHANLPHVDHISTDHADPAESDTYSAELSDHLATDAGQLDDLPADAAETSDVVDFTDEPGGEPATEPGPVVAPVDADTAAEALGNRDAPHAERSIPADQVDADQSTSVDLEVVADSLGDTDLMGDNLPERDSATADGQADTASTTDSHTDIEPTTNGHADTDSTTDSHGDVDEGAGVDEPGGLSGGVLADSAGVEPISMWASAEPPSRRARWGRARTARVGAVALPAHRDEWERRVLDDANLLDDIGFAVGGPFHLMYPERVTRNIHAFRNVFAETGVDGVIYYGKKANKAACVARACAENGIGVDVSSIGELTAALAQGVRGGELMVTGPAKSDELLWLAVRHGALIALDALDELHRLERIASTAIPARVLLRVQPADSHSRFGLSDTEIGAAMAAIGAAGPVGPAPIHLEGFSFHLAGYSAVDRAEQAAALIDHSLAARALGHPITTLSIGGGFGVDYIPAAAWAEFTAGVTPDWFHAGKSFDSYYPYHFPAPGPAMLSAILAHGDLTERLRDHDLRLAIEPGRALLDGAGSTVFRVRGSKLRDADGQPYQVLTVDGTSLSLSEQWFDSEYLPDPVLWPARPGEPAAACVGAATCLESDMLSWRRIPLPRAATVGDLLIYPNTAGYQMDSNESAFHDLPIPPKVVLHDAPGDRFRWSLDA